jgi:hypothetical protein
MIQMQSKNAGLVAILPCQRLSLLDIETYLLLQHLSFKIFAFQPKLLNLLGRFSLQPAGEKRNTRD